MFSIKIDVGLKQVMSMAYGPSTVTVELSKLVSRRALTKGENIDMLMDILLRYLNYTKCHNPYFMQILELHDNIILLSDKEISNKLNDILELFTSEKIEKFLTSENYTPPKGIIEEFNQSMVLNGEGDRDRTYTKKDYRDLVVLTIKLKAIAIILARYASIHNLNTNNSEAIKLYRIVNGIPSITSMSAYDKLEAFVNNNISDDSVKPDDVSRILQKSVTNTQLNSFILLNLLIYLSIPGTPDADDHSNELDPKDLVRKGLYRLCINKTVISRKHIINDPNMVVNDESGNSSVTDSFLSSSKIPIGVMEELIMVYNSKERIIQQLKIPIDLKYINDLKNVEHILLDKPLEPVQEVLLCWILVDTIEADSLDYLNRETILNFRIVAYAILKTAGLDDLANVMMATTYEDSEYLSKSMTNGVSDELENTLANLIKITTTRSSRKNNMIDMMIGEESKRKESDIQDMLIDPIVEDLATTKWISYALPLNDNVMIVPEARKNVIELMDYIHKHM